MTDPASRYQSVVDQQIQQAQERGEFDNLPGMGKPLPGRGRPDDDLWWVKGYLRREGLSTEALLPTSLQLAKEIERLPKQIGELPSEQAVREADPAHRGYVRGKPYAGRPRRSRYEARLCGGTHRRECGLGRLYRQLTGGDATADRRPHR